MPPSQKPDFDTTDVAAKLLNCSDRDLDDLEFGVVEMNHACIVLRYNAVESHFAGLSRERVVGRHFFREVAPCSDNRRVAHRYAQAALDETIAYTFAMRMKPVPVTLRMVKAPASDRMYLLVRWT